MKTISVAIATYNEEANLGRCLESIGSWADEIVLIDGSSTDKTVEIAEKYTDKIFIADNPKMFHINKQKALDKCSGKWILQLDADEVVSKDLKQEIIKAIGSQSIDGYFIPRKNFFMGRWMRKGGLYPDYVVRLFQKGKGQLPCKDVHEQVEITGKTDYLKHTLLHYPYPDFSKYLQKADTYTSLTAKNLHEDKLAKYVIVRPIKTFLSIYFRHLGFLDGFPGFVWAFYSALHYPIAYIKYWEKKNNN
ncbi:glycosyltransferase family 2 protein [Candidatus Microgenomates bacterium]|nr:glycosyltransferase family 2 protein [Candidatus Microgenomates bacterium]